MPRFVFCLVVGLCFAPMAFAGSTFTARATVSMQRNEPWVVNLFHDGHFWLGQTNDGINPNRIEIYDPTVSTRLGSVTLSHGVSYIQPYGDHSVIVLGRTPEAQAFFTVITRDGENYSGQTYGLDWNLPEFFTVGPQSLYFNEAGNADVFSYDSSGMQPLAPTISGPGAMMVVNNSLFVIERRDFKPGDENLVKIDLDTQQATRTFSVLRNGLSGLVYAPTINRVVLNETYASQLLFVNPDTNQLDSTTSVPTPTGLMMANNQVVVATGPGKSLAFIDVNKRAISDTWDLSSISALYNAWDVTGDVQSNRYYVRSQNVCPTCTQSRNLIVVAEATSATH